LFWIVGNDGITIYVHTLNVLLFFNGTN